MNAVYLTMLVGGALLSVIMALLGAGHGVGHSGAGQLHLHGAHAHGHAHVGHGHAHAGHASGGGDVLRGSMVWALSWLSPLTIGGFALLFGGAGLLAGGSGLALPIAIVAGLIGAVAIRALMSAFERSSVEPLSATPDGAIGEINATIRPGSSGQVSYTLEGLSRSVIARAEDPLVTIPRGTQVVITRREGGVAFVEPLDPLEGK
jgi:membrane protein implicated in regulation of membrane protease activity